MMEHLAASMLLIALLLVMYLGLSMASFQSFSKSFSKLLRYGKKRVDAWRFLIQGADMITMGYKKSAGQPFEVPGPDHSHVFISLEEHIGEVRKAGRDELSMFGATKQMFQPLYTMLGHNWLDERGAEGVGYVKAVGTLFPRQLLNIMPEMQRLVRECFETFSMEEYGSSGSIDLAAYALNKKLLCKLNGFCFFGDELAQNEIFMDKVFQYNELVITAAEVLRLLPEFMKGFVGPYIGKHAGVQNQVFNMINDVVARRLEEKRLAKSGEINLQLPNDMIQWIIDTAPPHLGWGSRRITYEIIAIWFGSVHALSATTTYVLFDLCKHPEYVEPLREEVESCEFDSFMKTTKGLPLLDSFMKESSRLSPIEAMSGRRQALRDFAFSDGTLIKKGDWACVPAKAILNDEKYFPRCESFEGFRFAPRDKIPAKAPGNGVYQPEGPSRYSDLSQNYHAWGIGSIICPGRFYSAVATKLIMAHILKTFDCSFVHKDMEKSRSWRSYVLPREGVLVRFSERK